MVIPVPYPNAKVAQRIRRREPPVLGIPLKLTVRNLPPGEVSLLGGCFSDGSASSGFLV